MEIVSADFLASWLLSFLPELTPRYEALLQSRAGTVSPYAFLWGVVAPSIRKNLTDQQGPCLAKIFKLLEIVGVKGDAQIQEALRMALIDDLSEELPQLVPYLGIFFLSNWVLRLAWYPQTTPQRKTINTHFRQKDLVKRWQDEIELIGGLSCLDVSAEMFIRWKLIKEFKIKGMEVAEPGSEAWLQLGRRWPMIPK